MILTPQIHKNLEHRKIYASAYLYVFKQQQLIKNHDITSCKTNFYSDTNANANEKVIVPTFRDDKNDVKAL